MFVPLISAMAILAQTTSANLTGTWRGSITAGQSVYDAITVSIDKTGSLTGAYDFTVARKNNWEKGEVKPTLVGKDGSFSILLHYPGQEKSWAGFKGKFVLSPDGRTLSTTDCFYYKPHSQDKTKVPATGSFKKIDSGGELLLTAIFLSLFLPQSPHARTTRSRDNKEEFEQGNNWSNNKRY